MVRRYAETVVSKLKGSSHDRKEDWAYGVKAQGLCKNTSLSRKSPSFRKFLVRFMFSKNKIEKKKKNLSSEEKEKSSRKRHEN